MSPENTIFLDTSASLFFSFAHTSMLAEPSRCPTSLNLTLTLSSIFMISSYFTPTNCFITSYTAFASYKGMNSLSVPFERFAFLLRHSASNIWICALSLNIISHNCTVASVQYILPLKPLTYKSGISPEWSICACVRRT